ncbi:MAG: alpha/beta fold hydrolase [Bacteroidota bacterium]
MPLLSSSSYRPPLLLRNRHAATMFPSLFRKVKGLHYERERLDTPDGDFLDLDWVQAGNNRLVIGLHGLEGSADRSYIRGMMRHFHRNKWDCMGLNFRSCSGEMNRKLRVYHSGETGDIGWVIDQILERDQYKEIVLVGFSMGANVALKYVGELGAKIPKAIRCVVAISAPCDLASCSTELNKEGVNRIYLKRFMHYLNEKLAHKLEHFPGEISLPQDRMPKDFAEFDNWFTAPMHGFEDAEDYWARASSLPFLPNIHVPSLIINARNDTFLGEECYPYEIADKHPLISLEVPRFGGHVGFAQFGTKGVYWSEQRALNFVSEKLYH